MSSPSTNMMVTAPISSRPLPQRFWMRCPAPGISHPIAGATTAIIPPAATGASVVFATAIEPLSVVCRCCLWPAIRDLDDYQLFLDFTGDFGARLAYEHVDFAAHPELRQIDPGLHREARVRQQFADIVRFQIIHVRAITVNFG